jgi:hypothetical protein
MTELAVIIGITDSTHIFNSPRKVFLPAVSERRNSAASHRRSGFARADALAVIALLAVAGSIMMAKAPFSQQQQMLADSINRLQNLGKAGGFYQNDNRNYLPITLSYSRGITQTTGTQLEGWCTWSFGGKNNDAWWAAGAFDVEAADRPLNTYVFGRRFSAPPSPQRLAANAPQRRNDQADPFRDPSDDFTRQRSWPSPTIIKGVTTYNDVGTSYLWNVGWWRQANQFPGGFTQQFNEGTRRIAAQIGTPPSRFVWATDNDADVIVYQSSSTFRLLNGYGDINASVMLTLDGNVRYLKVRPGIQTTPEYTLQFVP